MKTQSIALIAIVGMTFSLGVNSSTASQFSVHSGKYFSSVFSPNQEKTKKCLKAEKKTKALKQKANNIKKQGSTNLNKFLVAHNKYISALNNAGKICYASGVEPIATPTFSGIVKDPRPQDWVRPIDGSGLPGSNFADVVVSGECPITISKVEMWEQILDSGGLIWALRVEGENYSPEKVKFNYTVKVATGESNTPWDAVPSRGWLGNLELMNKDMEVEAWKNWSYASFLLQNSDTAFGDLDAKYLGSTITCL
jgi:hypothetical protein